MSTCNQNICASCTQSLSVEMLNYTNPFDTWTFSERRDSASSLLLGDLNMSFNTLKQLCVSRNDLTLTLQLLQEWFGDFPACFLHVRLQIMWQKSRFKTFLETNDGKMDQGDPDGDIFRGVLCSLPRVACCILYLQPVKISQFSIFFPERNSFQKFWGRVSAFFGFAKE